MFGWLTRLVDVRAGEVRRVASMFALLGLIIATSYILKPVRSSLFLSQFGSERLPYVYILVAIVLGVVAFVFAKFAPRANLPRLFMGAAYFFAVNLVLFWVATTSGAAWMGFAFYVWVSIYTALMPSLFWLLANYVFYANEGRRLFPVVMAGGIFGSIAGGATTSVLVRFIGTPGLLLAAAAILLAIAWLVRSNAAHERERMSERRYEIARQEKSRAVPSDENPWRLVARSRYLTLLAILIALTTTTSTLVDYQFNTVVEQSFASMDALTGFFGTFFAGINVVAFVLQLVVVGRLLNRFGVGAGLLMLPVALLGSSISFLLLPQLLTAALIKASDDGLSNSVNKASMEVLYLPIALSVKNRLKAWLDMFVERVSRGVAGVTILVATSLFSLSVSQISVVVVALLIPWIGLVLALRRAYIKTFRDSLSRRDISDFASQLRDPASLSVFRQVLDGADARELVYALELSQGVDDPEILERVSRLATHDDSGVRKAAFRFLRSAPEPPRLGGLERLTRDEDPAAAAEALALWVTVEPEAGLEALRTVVEKGAVDRIDAILDTLDISRDLVGETDVEGFVAERCDAEDAHVRRQAARAAGFLHDGADEAACLRRLIADTDIEVARAAAVSIGKIRDENAYPLLIQALARRPLRAAARKAIARFGIDKLDGLVETFRNDGEDLDVRAALPLVIAELDDAKAVSALLQALPQDHWRLHYQGVKALGKLRKHSSSLRFSRTEVDRLLKGEAARLSALASLRAGASTVAPELESHRLLLRVLVERLEFTRERIFRLLGLTHPADAVYSAFDRIVNGRPALRAAALEYLSNTLSTRHREWLLPLVEAADWDDVHTRSKRLFGSSDLSFQEALTRLVRHLDPWLAATAVTVVGDLDDPALESEIRVLAGHTSPLVREAVQAALSAD